MPTINNALSKAGGLGNEWLRPGYCTGRTGGID